MGFWDTFGKVMLGGVPALIAGSGKKKKPKTLGLDKEGLHAKERGLLSTFVSPQIGISPKGIKDDPDEALELMKQNIVDQMGQSPYSESLYNVPDFQFTPTGTGLPYFGGGQMYDPSQLAQAQDTMLKFATGQRSAAEIQGQQDADAVRRQVASAMGAGAGPGKSLQAFSGGMEARKQQGQSKMEKQAQEQLQAMQQFQAMEDAKKIQDLNEAMSIFSEEATDVQAKESRQLSKDLTMMQHQLYMDSLERERELMDVRSKDQKLNRSINALNAFQNMRKK